MIEKTYVVEMLNAVLDILHCSVFVAREVSTVKQEKQITVSSAWRRINT